MADYDTPTLFGADGRPLGKQEWLGEILLTVKKIELAVSQYPLTKYMYLPGWQDKETAEFHSDEDALFDSEETATVYAMVRYSDNGTPTVINIPVTIYRK